ncbi:3-hydroxyacyl-ACP dehydratase FabZ [Aureimonas fodinaquatilis]|uniref:3-hydroxyacyl-[acyl-carrier-protein] dehydratase FabZ n=1 Tax=Aureimonas fodinaquatilis TaxID=2565783 RepID=A0A5B0DXL8_9HYPH|nr:3-hydroxyacyl-ACP dehydratase FabZ [Aureimonas fodinaquatilis]KAA0970491.1 3-hydroxyacyl-ACP dehydratase FabZ [Aureimonas fodinaquatilis]
MSETAAVLDSMDIMDIMAVLPHRYPFLLVDRIIEIDGDRSAIGIKNVTASEPHFQGHFPENPVMPGVLIIEGMAQTAGAICTRSQKSGSPSLVYLMTIDKAKFRKPVVPGNTLEYHVVQSKKRGNIWRFECVAKVDGNKVAEATVSAMVATREAA